MNRHLRSLEFLEIDRHLKNFRRSPEQKNGLYTSDVEILRQRRSGDVYFCCSTDSLAEEIDLGLYRDPYTWGWMTVMSSVSDLAVSGARPLGFLLANQWIYGCKESVKSRFFAGARAALKKSEVFLLGGDSGSAASHSHTGTIFGESRLKPCTRIGVRPGDAVVILGHKAGGLGPVLAFDLLLGSREIKDLEKCFRPQPDLRLAAQVAGVAHASIDTSDGLASCLYTIGKLNRVGFQLQWNDLWAAPRALRYCLKHRIHPAMLILGDHGDFQSLFFVPKKNLSRLPDSCLLLGHATSESDITLQYGGHRRRLPIEDVVRCPREFKAIRARTFKLNRLMNSVFG